MHSTAQPIFHVALWVYLHFCGILLADSGDIQIEKRIIKYIASDGFSAMATNQKCHDERSYRVYLIDNFEQTFQIVPEVQTSHGELLVRLLQSGRDDIDIHILNTSLSKGLAQVIDALRNESCVDAVVSAIPGSNYTYDQISTLFFGKVHITSENILYHSGALKKLMRDIAFRGFPSVAWLEQIDANSVKLRNDARKFAFIEALGRYNVPVILPYGNLDATYKGKVKSVNILSLAANAKVFSALDREGQRVAGYPYSPLSSGDEPAIYPITECPDSQDPFKAHLDINGDGYFEYTFVRSGKIAYRDEQGRLSFAPPVLSPKVFATLLARLKNDSVCRLDAQIVLTAGQFGEVKTVCHMYDEVKTFKSFVWVNAPGRDRFHDFEACCWERGTISGTSVIPPLKVKEMLPSKDR